jgi:hypothetical protein
VLIESGLGATMSSVLLGNPTISVGSGYTTSCWRPVPVVA